MKFSAEDLRNASFERRFRGYDQEQVHELLESVAREWEMMCKELQQLQDTNARQAEQVRDFQSRERGLIDALQAAKSVADEIKHKASAEAAQKLEDAQQQAKQLITKAERKQAALLDEVKELKQQRQRLEQDMRSILGAHLMVLDNPPASRTDPYPIEEPNVRRKPRSAQHSTTMKITDQDIASSRDLQLQSADHDDWDFEMEEIEDYHNAGTLVGMGQTARTITSP